MDGRLMDGRLMDGRPQAARRRPRVKPARLWWLVHQWAGLKLAILLTFVFATGTLAVLSHEIDWLLQPGLRVSPATVSRNGT